MDEGQATQLTLGFPEWAKRMATRPPERFDASAAGRTTERPASTERLMEEVCEERNLKEALRNVRANKGAPGIDGMTVEELSRHLREHGPAIRGQLLAGTYKPKPVRRVEIPKPGGGVRKLGIPTVLDRFVQQAILQVLQGSWDRTFSDHSYGFRPKRSAHQAVAAAQKHVADGHSWVVDLDLEKFFDRVNHDILMGRLARRIADKRVLKVIRAFLNAGVMEDGLVSPTEEGTPQGGPLSPFLSNVVLDDLDRELERRGHRFIRYADDCNIYVRSERAGRRVMETVARFIERRLKLKVNGAKSAVDRPWRRKFLGFVLRYGQGAKRAIAPEALDRFRDRIRDLTRRSRGIGMRQRVARLRKFMLGWRNYFGFTESPQVFDDLDVWIRRRLRAVVWKQWGRGKNRRKQLRRRGVKGRALGMAFSQLGPWRLSHTPVLYTALPDASFDSIGLPRLSSEPA